MELGNIAELITRLELVSNTEGGKDWQTLTQIEQSCADAAIALAAQAQEIERLKEQMLNERREYAERLMVVISAATECVGIIGSAIVPPN